MPVLEDADATTPTGSSPPAKERPAIMPPAAVPAAAVQPAVILPAVILPAVILIESSRLVREGLLGILQPAAFRVVAAVPTPEAALAAQVGPLADQVIDLLLCSLEPQQDMPALLAALAPLQQRGTIRHTVLLLPACSTEDLTLAVLAGVDGVILKDISAGRLLRALDLVLNGQGLLPMGAAAQILASMREGGRTVPAVAPPSVAAPDAQDAQGVQGARDDDMRPPPRNPSLSDRERQILQCLVEGYANKLIARRLAIAEATVKVHIKGLLRKINVSNRTQAAIWALNHGALMRTRGAAAAADVEEGGDEPHSLGRIGARLGVAVSPQVVAATGLEIVL